MSPIRTRQTEPDPNSLPYPAEATVGNQALRKAPPEHRAALAFSRALALFDPELGRRTAAIAYDLYERRGRVDGYDLHDWLWAERLIRLQWPPLWKGR